MKCDFFLLFLQDDAVDPFTLFFSLEVAFDVFVLSSPWCNLHG